MLYVFIRGLTGRIFKMLPLREESDTGTQVYLTEYMDSLARDVIGAMTTFPELSEFPEYITVVNTIQYLNTNESDSSVFRKEVFHMLTVLNGIDSKLRAGDPNV